MITVVDKEELDWLSSDSEISLEKEVDEEKEEFRYNPEFVRRIKGLHAIYDLREKMYPECKDSDRPAIMDDVEAFRYGFKFPENAHRNLTKSTLTKIMKDFLDFGSLPDSLFVLGNVKFLTKLFDLEEVREQVKAYLKSPYTIKSDDFVIALDCILNREPRITEAEKKVVRELLEYINE